MVVGGHQTGPDGRVPIGFPPLARCARLGDAHRDHGRGEPCIQPRRRPHGSGLGKRRWPVERSRAWLLQTLGTALGPKRFHRPVAAPGRLHIPGRRSAHPPILKFVSYGPGVTNPFGWADALVPPALTARAVTGKAEGPV
jgi:hypothetical protein